jgi:hypothetical protein
MARTNTVRLSDSEKELLERVREVEFGTDSVPLGEVLGVTCDKYLQEKGTDV